MTNIQFPDDDDNNERNEFLLHQENGVNVSGMQKYDAEKSVEIQYDTTTPDLRYTKASL